MRKELVLCTLLLAPALAFGQAGAAGVNRELPRDSYDPGAQAGLQANQKSMVETTLQKINPQNKDYGQVIELGRIPVMEETIEDFYWWAILVLCVLLIVGGAYICWLVREREVRLNISAEIVAQLYNSHIVSRAKALEAIEKHNRLADRYNAKCEELAATKAMALDKEQKRKRKGDADIASKLAEDPTNRNETNVERSIGESTTETGEGDEFTEAPSAGGDSGKETTRLNELVRSLQAQAKAQNQKISNLRGQLNRAHDQYKLQPQQPREA